MTSDTYTPAFENLLATLQHACDRFHIATLTRQIDVCRGLLCSDAPIDVVILGQFKAGKSTFINSLMEQPLLPVGVVPVTTAITRLQHGTRKRAVVTHFDGHTTEIGLRDVGDFIAEERNPGNGKNVEVVDIDIPSLAGLRGLRLVDTPGLGSVFQYHKTTAESWLPEVGAAILAVSADRPLSAHDMQLIRELMTHTPRIILLLTKVDLLTPDQRKEVISFFETVLGRELHIQFPIYAYSVREGVETWRELLKKEVLFPLVVNRKNERETILQHKIGSIADACRNYLEIALRTSQRADLESNSLKRQILDEKVSYDLVRQEMFTITRENQKQTLEIIRNYLSQFVMPLSEKLKESLQRDMAGWKVNLWRFTRNYEEWLHLHMTEEMRAISEREHKHFFGTLRESHASLSRSLDNFRRSLGDNIQRVLGVTLEEVQWNIGVTDVSHPDIRTPRAFDYHVDLIWFLIPMVVFRKLFENNFIGKIRWEVEVNLSRLAAQWVDSINAVIDSMRGQAVRYVEDELTTVESLLSKTHGRTDEIREMIHVLEAQLIDTLDRSAVIEQKNDN